MGVVRERGSEEGIEEKEGEGGRAGGRCGYGWVVGSGGRREVGMEGGRKDWRDGWMDR